MADENDFTENDFTENSFSDSSLSENSVNEGSGAEQDKIELLDFIDIDLVRKSQAFFTKFSGLQLLVTDNLGVPLTQDTVFTDYCQLVRNTPRGKKQCQYCVRFGAEQNMINGVCEPFTCHAGVDVYVAPIITNGQNIACLTSGFVTTEGISQEQIKECSEEIGVEEEKLLEASKKIPRVTKEELQESASLLVIISDIFSDVAFGKYMAEQANREILRAAKLKSDFLANMSHEIRTPMNAVIGMADLALRENLSPEARNYINQIKSSGRSLLTIINDILDFSKIESGKMSIMPENYVTISMFNDVANITQTRLQDKNVELILDVNPSLPYELFGDSQRIRQVLINILNNAAKFTTTGQVKLSVNFLELTSNTELLEFADDENFFEESGDTIITEADLDAFIRSRDVSDQKKKLQASSDSVLLEVSVLDTGIGIKKDDLKKIFNSFQQVDSKRNRNIEGTGLGLTISKRLVSMMDGNLWVESEYGKGSTFYFSVPQKIVQARHCADVKEPETFVVAGMFKNEYVRNQFKKDAAMLKLAYSIISDPEKLALKIEKLLFLAKGRVVYFFVEEILFTKEVQEVLRGFQSLNVVLLMDFFANKQFEGLDIMVLRKPLSVFAMASLLNKEDVAVFNAQNVMNESGFDVVAPDAKVLVVDDNIVNLSVVEGLLEPFQMQISTATSGPESIKKCQSCKYDIVFMDHMMPGMDGVEATKIIRQIPGYEKSPIIALTANAIGGAKAMFLSNGFTEFIPKPIEMKELVSQVKKWLPQNLMRSAAPSDFVVDQTNRKLLVADLDTSYAVGLLGSKKLFWKILKEYFKAIYKKCDSIITAFQNEKWEEYTIEVHALKSSSRQIGALLLSDKAAELEQAGKEKNIDFIKENTHSMLEKYISYAEVLKPFIENMENETATEEVKLEEVDVEKVKEKLEALKQAADDLDTDAMEKIAGELNHYKLDEQAEKLLVKICDAIDNIDSDAVVALVEEWLGRL